VALKKDKDEAPKRKRRPAATPEAREHQLIGYAVDLVEKRLLAGTATSQEVTHFLKLGSTREQLEQQRLRHENELTSAKVDALASQQRQEELYAEALMAMRSYAGQAEPDEYDDYDED
jgi:hypothetical protein